MPRATVTIKGQVTIPKAVRDHLSIEAGDQVDFRFEEGRRVVLEPVTVRAADLKGILRRPGMRPLRTEEMDLIIRQRAGRRAARR
jgi:AbrB family looped-hinge helix DNA binding protein